MRASDRDDPRPMTATLSDPTPGLPSPAPIQHVLGACPHDCPDTCSLVTTVQDGVALRVAGNPAHVHTDGVLCAKVSRYTCLLYTSPSPRD